MRRLGDGFSLVEVLVALAVFSIVGGAVLLTLLSTHRTWSFGAGQAVTTANLRRVLDRMGWELAQSAPAQIQWPGPGNSSSMILFRIPQDRDGDGVVLNESGKITEWSNPIQYGASTVAGSGFPALQRLVQNGGAMGGVQTEVLAHRLSRVTFSRPWSPSDVVNITIGTFTVTEQGQTVERLISHKVKLRNS